MTTLPEHSEHGASSCKRWWNCPGSVALTRGLPDDASPYAAEGTAAHELAALCLESGQDAIEYVGRTVAGFNVDSDMAEAVQVYLDHCRVILATSPDVVQHIEHRFSLASLNPPAPMYGTADFVASYGGWLWVVDLKYGQGVQVEAEGNPQLRYYALGALIGNPGVRYIQASIVQPRAPGSPAIRIVDLDPVDLVEWSVELMDRAAATLQPGAELVPGDWCRSTFCKARGVCVARADAAVPSDVLDPRIMTSQDIGRILDKADMLDGFLRDVRAAATAEISRGGSIPGWKLVPTRPSQSWRDDAEADAALEDLHGFGEERYRPRAVISPAQARDALADRIHANALDDWMEHRDVNPGTKLRKPPKSLATEAARARLADLIVTASSGVNLAPDADARPALPAAGAEFLALPDVHVISTEDQTL